MLRKNTATFQPTRQSPNWREYQTRLKRTKTNKKIIRSMLKLSPAFFLVIIAIYITITSFSRVSCQHTEKSSLVQPELASLIKQPEALVKKQAEFLSKKDVQTIFDKKSLNNIDIDNEVFECIGQSGQRYQVDTTLDIQLQKLILQNFDRSNSRHIGFVAMEPSTGRILALAGFDKKDPLSNPCVDNRFPAASIFKIITAAAAVEKCGFGPTSSVSFNGGKHTLYKSQLGERTNKYTSNFTLKKSFAESVNPVFGKIGSKYLGKQVLEHYAAAFGFNHVIDFEIPLPLSDILLEDDPFQLAEVASGYNKTTEISPLHGVLFSAMVLNQGELVEPSIVDSVTDENGNIVYKTHPNIINTAISSHASTVLNELMQATISSGTCRKAFRGYGKDPVLSKLNIGGKTGSINNKANDIRYDWFVGFAEDKEGQRQIALSVLVAHQKYIGKRASYYARIAIKDYFEKYFSEKKQPSV